jgi:heptosyltransferase-3
MSKNPNAIDFSALRRVLLIKLRHHGDVLLTSPVIQVLKNHYPHLEIDALVYAETQDMLSEHPALSELHLIDRNWKKEGIGNQVREELALFNRLKARSYDLVIHLTENNRAAWLCHFLKPRYAITPVWRNKTWFWKHSFTHHYPVPARLRHTVEKHLDALRHLGLHPNDEERGLILVPGEQAKRRVQELIQQHGLDEEPFLHFHPTSRWLFKCWSIDRCRSLIELLQERGHQVVITAAPAKAELAMVSNILEPLAEPVIDLSGQLSLKELAALTARARCFVGMDSVPMHIAAAMGTPTVALFGPSGDQEWGPWMVPNHILISDISCRPCGMDGCGGSKISDCLEHIRPEDALAAIEDLIAS